MFRLAWATDIHLNFLKHPGAAKMFGEYLADETQADALLVTGDISEAPTLEMHLEELETGFAKPVYFVLGNHDYYRGSFSESHLMAQTFEGWLNDRIPVELAPNVALVGNEGWYDATIGNPYSERFSMSDWIAIEEIRETLQKNEDEFNVERLSKKARAALIELCRQRSAALAAEAKTSLEAALKNYEWVIFATHYPPFREACWHEGHYSGEMWLPWFTSKLMGDTLIEVTKAHPDRKILVLCGHSHSSGTYAALPNLLVLTGEAVYGAPDLAGILHIDATGVLARFKVNKRFVDIAPFSPRSSVRPV